MTVNQIVRSVAGLFVMLSLSLGVTGSPLFVSQNWLWFTLFVGANLFQSGFTKFCPLDMILVKLVPQKQLRAQGVKESSGSGCA